MKTGILAVTLLIWGSGSVLAAPFDNIHTHTTAVPESFASSGAFKLAATWFLPDWQAGMSNRTEKAPSSSGDIALGCDKYSPTCTAPKILGGTKVRVAGDLFCYTTCVCPSSYKYTSENCTGAYILGSETCDGKSNSCTSRSCTDGGYLDSPKTGWNCTAVTYGAHSCYSCSDPCDGLTDKSPCTYGCQSEYAACPSKCETCYPDNCHNLTDNTTDYGCEKNYDDCPSKCETGKTCSKTDCSEFPMTYKPTNATYQSCTPGCGDNTTTYKITKCDEGYKLLVSQEYNTTDCLYDICPDSGSKTACAEDQELIGTLSTDYGSTCYYCKDKCKNVPSGSEWYVGTLDELRNSLGVTIVADWYTAAEYPDECHIENILAYTTPNGSGNTPVTVTDTCGVTYTHLCQPYYKKHGWETVVPTIPTDYYGQPTAKLLSRQSCGKNYYCLIHTCASDEIDYRGYCVRYGNPNCSDDNCPQLCSDEFISAYTDNVYKCLCRNSKTCKSWYGKTSGYSCVKGECVLSTHPCNSDADCGTTDVCDPDSHKCVTRTECINNAQCQQSLGRGWCNYGECHYQWDDKACYYDYDCSTRPTSGMCNLFFHQCPGNNVY